MLKEGYSAVTAAVAETLDIRLCTEVKTVRLDSRRRRVLVTATFEADFCVVTLPLGLLQARRGGVVFEPELPEAKRRSIARLGFGLLNKVALLFPHVFWDQLDFIGHVSEERGNWPLFADLSRMTGQPILLAMTGGAAAAEQERRPDTDTVASLMAVIRKIYRGAPAPLRSEVTRWRSDRYSRGTFSYLPPGACAADYEEMAAPVCDGGGVPRLLFAGEATTKHHPSTVHGAWLSGVREANRLDLLLRPRIARERKRGRNGGRGPKEVFSPDILYQTSVVY
ncbi:unnamed protein product, partial [Phaeothamnion confervicola]